MAQIDFSLQNRIPDGNGKLLVGDLSPTDGSYSTENQYLTWMKGKILYSGYLYNGDFYKESAHTNVISKVDGAIYVDLSDGTNLSLYYCDNTTYKPLTEEAQVQAIIDGLNDGTIVPLKAKQDQNGNVIDQTYETKAEASDLKSAIDANSKRITNLETKAGDEIPVTYPSATYGMDGVPASVAPYAKVKELIMNSRVHNQLVQNGNFADSSNWNVSDATLSINSNKAIVTNNATTSSFKGLYQTNCINTDHRYLFSAKIKNLYSSSVQFYISQPYADSAHRGSVTIDASKEIVASVLFDGDTSLSNKDLLIRAALSNVANSYEVSEVLFTDLNVHFGGTIPTNASTIAQIQQNYPELLIPSDYDTGTRVDTTYSAVESEGVNLWNEQWELGDINGSTGQDAPSTTSIRSIGYIEVPYGEVIFIHSPTTRIIVYSYDAEKNFISYQTANNNTAINLPSNTRYIRFNQNTTSYNYDIQICLNSYADKTTYHPHTTDTLSLPSPVTGKSAGSVHQIYYPETGEMTEPFGSYTFIGNETLTDRISSFGRVDFNGISSIIKGSTENALMVGFEVVDAGSTTTQSTVDRIAVASDGRLLIQIPSQSSVAGYLTYLTGKTIIFELASPNPNSQATDPVLDPFIKVEGNGTIRPVQSQTTQIDSAMSVDYLGV